MEISNNYSTAKVWNTSNKNVSKSSKKNKWKLTDSLKEKIVDLAKKDAQDNVYMGNAFMNLRKTEVSKVAPNRAALIGKQTKNGSVCCLEYLMRQNIREQGQARQFMYTMKRAKKF